MADKMPPAPAADMDDQTDGAAPADDTGGDDTGGDQGTVLCTIMKNDDGSYTVTEGDEDDEEDEGEDMGGAPGAQGGDMGAEKPEGQTFHEPGQVLKAVLDILQKDGEAAGGATQDHFQAGFSGDNAPTPKKPVPKY